MQQILEFYWQYKKEKYSQWMNLFDTETEKVNSIKLANYSFNFKLSDQRFCTGYFEKKEHHPCPFKNVLDGKQVLQCVYCEKKRGFYDAFIMRREPNDNIKSFIESEQLVYLAFFEPDIVKVGSVALNRRYIRPIEQDALVYAFIAKAPNAIAVQDLERAIAKKVGITEFVMGRNKFKYITYKSKSDKAKAYIERTFERIKREFPDKVFDQAQITDLRFNDQIYYPDDKIKKMRDMHYLVGEFRGLRNKYLIINNNGRDLAFNKRYIEGRFIEDYIDNYQYNFDDDERLELF